MEQIASTYKKNNNLKWHFICWAIFIAYEIIVVLPINHGFSRPIDYLTFYSLNIGLFYLTANIIIKNSANGKVQYVKIILYILAELGLYTVVKYYITPLYVVLGFYKPALKPLSVFGQVSGVLFRAIYFIGFATAYAFSQLTLASRQRISDLDKQALQNQLEQERLQKSLLASEYAFLKAQINPHFLFNMLSFLHSKVYKYSDELGDQVIHLADLMRYAFNEPGEDGKVELAGEIAHIENYLDLNRSRFNNNLQLKFTTTGNIDDIRIIPLMLITIIENVFKYADLSNPDAPAIVTINVTGRQLHLHVANRKIKRKHAISSGIGMVNVQKRLDQAYPDRYRIDIEQDEQSYRLDLMINVPEDEVLHN